MAVPAVPAALRPEACRIRLPARPAWGMAAPAGLAAMVAMVTLRPVDLAAPADLVDPVVLAVPAGLVALVALVVRADVLPAPRSNRSRLRKSVWCARGLIRARSKPETNKFRGEGAKPKGFDTHFFDAPPRQTPKAAHPNTPREAPIFSNRVNH